MTDDATVTVERQTPQEAFGLLSNDLRVDILQVLGDERDPLAFSDLRERVGERDSGKFNYHLGKLVGHLVVRTDDGYRLSLAGRKMYGAILSGAYTTEAEIEPFEFEGPCPMCGRGHLVAEYTDERARLHCPDCGQWRNEFSFPPASLGQFDREELPRAFDRWMRATVSRFVYGFCANCGGRVDGHLERVDDPDYPIPVRARYDCERCGDSLESFPALIVMFDPRAVSFYADHGVDLLMDPSWWHFTDEDAVDVELGSEDPVTARVTIRLGDDVLEATVDTDATVDVIQTA